MYIEYAQKIIALFIAITLTVITYQLYHYKQTIYTHYSILIAIVTTDHYFPHIDSLHSNIKKYLKYPNIELVIVTRENDEKTISKCTPLANYMITVPNYSIPKGEKDSLPAIAGKRNLVLKFAASRKYRFVWFIDPNIIPGPYLAFLLSGCLEHNYKVMTMPYIVPLLGYPAVGGIKGPIKVKHNRSNIKYQSAFFVGMGCTLIAFDAFHHKFEVMRIEQVGTKNHLEGDEIGFCYHCAQANDSIGYIDKLAKLS